MSPNDAPSASGPTPAHQHEHEAEADGVAALVSAALRQAWRVVIIVVGFSVLAVGVAMIVLPGPAVVVIPVGLAILGTEFLWARRLLQQVRAKVKEGAERIMPAGPR